MNVLKVIKECMYWLTSLPLSGCWWLLLACWSALMDQSFVHPRCSVISVSFSLICFPAMTMSSNDLHLLTSWHNFHYCNLLHHLRCCSFLLLSLDFSMHSMLCAQISKGGRLNMNMIYAELFHCILFSAHYTSVLYLPITDQWPAVYWIKKKDYCCITIYMMIMAQQYSIYQMIASDHLAP